MDMRMMLSGSEPMRLEPISAKRAVAVHETATKREIISPVKGIGWGLLYDDI